MREKSKVKEVQSIKWLFEIKKKKNQNIHVSKVCTYEFLKSQPGA